MATWIFLTENGERKLIAVIKNIYLHKNGSNCNTYLILKETESNPSIS